MDRKLTVRGVSEGTHQVKIPNKWKTMNALIAMRAPLERGLPGVVSNLGGGGTGLGLRINLRRIIDR